MRHFRSAVWGLAAVGAVLGGCATYVPAGGISVHVTAGVDANPGVTGSKRGSACMKSVVGAVAWGDASIGTAMRNGHITKVATVDYRVVNILGAFGKYCTVVTGE